VQDPGLYDPIEVAGGFALGFLGLLIDGLLG
jgi:hypothetical protein